MAREMPISISLVPLSRRMKAGGIIVVDDAPSQLNDWKICRKPK